jgi:hypothetical protein
MAQGLDNFLYDLAIDGGTANFKFWDPNDPTNTAEVSVSPKEFPEGVTAAASREVADYAYSLVSKQLNDKRADKAKAEAQTQLDAQAAADKEAKAATAAHLSEAQDNSTAPLGTEKREDGVTQNVFSSTVDSSASKDNKKK